MLADRANSKNWEKKKKHARLIEDMYMVQWTKASIFILSKTVINFSTHSLAALMLSASIT